MDELNSGERDAFQTGFEEANNQLTDRESSLFSECEAEASRARALAVDAASIIGALAGLLDAAVEKSDDPKLRSLLSQCEELSLAAAVLEPDSDGIDVVMVAPTAQASQRMQIRKIFGAFDSCLGKTTTLASLRESAPYGVLTTYSAFRSSASVADW
jgi:hypothetical protein